jgi:hypothetical protein
VTKTPVTGAKRIEREMHRARKDWARYENEHCALFEKESEQICPTEDKDRRKKLVKFAEQYRVPSKMIWVSFLRCGSYSFRQRLAHCQINVQVAGDTHLAGSLAVRRVVVCEAPREFLKSVGTKRKSRAITQKNRGDRPKRNPSRVRWTLACAKWELNSVRKELSARRGLIFM